MIQAMPAISSAAATKIASSAPRDSPPELCEVVVVGTVSGPVCVLVDGVVVVGVVIDGTVVDSDPLVALAGAAIAALNTSPQARTVAIVAQAAWRLSRRRRGIAAIYPPACALNFDSVPQKQRQIRMEQRVGGPELMEEMQTRSDEQLEAETKYRSIAMAILGGRAAERYDAASARSYFQRAIAAARPQERMQIRRMADASLALAERRADDLREAVEKLGQEPPSGRQLFGLRMMGLVAPPRGTGIVRRVRGVLLAIVLVIVFIAAGLGVVELIALPFGGIGLPPGVLLGLIVDGVALAVMVQLGRRRRNKALANRAAAR
jgi:hypothetical protein